MNRTIRVSAAQFHVGNDVHKNLETCLRVIREAGKNKPDLLVLPEFANHCSWYDDAEHCYRVSVDFDGEFLRQIAAAVRDISAHVVINCTLRRAANRVTGTSIMMAPDGSILGTTNKQVLIGHENDFLDPATEAGPVIATPLGRLAMYSCMDGVINETPRCLALRGAEVLCNSLNSFALDEGSLHIPVRAAENKVWVVAANKVGPLIPEDLVAPVSAATSIPPHFLDGAGDSQIVAPDGSVLALAGKGEEIIFADIQPAVANDKSRPNGSDIFASRRPSFYSDLGENPAEQTIEIHAPSDVAAAAIATLDDFDAAIAAGAKLVCLAAGLDATQLRIPANVLVAAGTACGEQVQLLDSGGVLLTQESIHAADKAARIEVADTQYGRIAVLSGDDIAYPETVRLAALQSVSTVMVPAQLQEDWEGRTGVVERSAENRVNIVLASAAPGVRGSVIASLQKDFTIMAEWHERPFDGLLSAPVVFRAESDGELLAAEIHPAAASNKECSRNTHLLASRPWQILQAMLQTD
ncbi:MAG: hydrolase [Gammaproteobacteria bacterium]|nr:hydrolase [Gammaproteobacteria bacterium]